MLSTRKKKKGENKMVERIKTFDDYKVFTYELEVRGISSLGGGVL